jgi:hypothetical protein
MLRNEQQIDIGHRKKKKALIGIAHESVRLMSCEITIIVVGGGVIVKNGCASHLTDRITGRETVNNLPNVLILDLKEVHECAMKSRCCGKTKDT